MRFVLALAAMLVLLSVSGALAQSQPRFTRVAWGGDGYHLSFEIADPSASPPVVSWSDGSGWRNVTPTRVHGPADDDDAMYLAELPARAGTYGLNGIEGVLSAPPDKDAPVRVAFLSDMGRGPDAQAIWSAIEKSEPDLVIIGGDISYAHGRSDAWDEWFQLVEPLARRVPVMVAFGNHESYCQEGALIKSCAREIEEYMEHFHMPNAPKRYYDFDWGPAHFLALDTEAYEPRDGIPSTDPAEQRAFASRSLLGSTANWNIAFFHRPLYSTTRSGEKQSPEAREHLAPTLEQDGVDLVLTGHAHSYERSWPLRDGEVTRRTSAVRQGEGWVHVVSGGGGRSLYPEFGPAADWSAKRAASFHFVQLDISPEQLRVRAVLPDGSTLDEFVIRRPPESATMPDAPLTTPAPTEPLAPTASITPSSGATSNVPSVGPLAVLATCALWALGRRR